MAGFGPNCARASTGTRSRCDFARRCGLARMRSDLERLEDILRAIDNADKYKDGGEERFQRDELVRVWALHHLPIIGEAARRF